MSSCQGGWERWRLPTSSWESRGDLYEVLVEARDALQKVDILIRSGKDRRLAEGAVRTTRTIEPSPKTPPPVV